MKKELTANQQLIENDIMRYKNNSLAATLVYVALVFECLYFIVMYGQICGSRTEMFSDGKTTVYSMQTGVSVILNLFILLFSFYASVQLKNYNKKYSYVVWVIAAIQIVRIFIYPLQSYTDTLYSNGKQLFGTGTFLLLVIYLVLSAAAFIGAGVVGFIRTSKLEKFNKSVPVGSEELETAYKEEDVAEEVVENA